jgi:hypothetical protein
MSEAAEAIRDVLSIEPQLTLAKLRARLMAMEEKVWLDYSTALRLAGFPE